MNSKDLFETPEWKEFQEAQTSWEQEFEASSEALWNSFSKEDQLKIFCAVVRRIYKAELEDKGTYRYALYDVFEFGPESYAPAQMSGYLALHNSMVNDEPFFSKKDELWQACQQFIDSLQICHPETVYISNRVAEKSLRLIEEICNIVGYHPPCQEDEEL